MTPRPSSVSLSDLGMTNVVLCADVFSHIARHFICKPEFIEIVTLSKAIYSATVVERRKHIMDAFVRTTYEFKMDANAYLSAPIGTAIPVCSIRGTRSGIFRLYKTELDAPMAIRLVRNNPQVILEKKFPTRIALDPLVLRAIDYWYLTIALRKIQECPHWALIYMDRYGRGANAKIIDQLKKCVIPPDSLWDRDMMIHHFTHDYICSYSYHGRW